MITEEKLREIAEDVLFSDLFNTESHILAGAVLGALNAKLPDIGRRDHVWTNGVNAGRDYLILSLLEGAERR